MDKNIKKLLDKAGVRYQILPHRKVYTAFNSAETQHLKPKELAKTVLVKLDRPVAFIEEPADTVKKFALVLAALPASKRLDFKKLNALIFALQTRLYKKLIKAHLKLPKPIRVKTSMAKERDIVAKLKLKKGLPAPFGLFGLPVFLDKSLAKNPQVIVSAGSYTESLKLKTKDYLKLEAPTIGNLSQ